MKATLQSKLVGSPAQDKPLFAALPFVLCLPLEKHGVEEPVS